MEIEDLLITRNITKQKQIHCSKISKIVVQYQSYETSFVVQQPASPTLTITTKVK